MWSFAYHQTNFQTDDVGLMKKMDFKLSLYISLNHLFVYEQINFYTLHFFFKLIKSSFFLIQMLSFNHLKKILLHHLIICTKIVYSHLHCSKTSLGNLVVMNLNCFKPSVVSTFGWVRNSRSL